VIKEKACILLFRNLFCFLYNARIKAHPRARFSRQRREETGLSSRHRAYHSYRVIKINSHICSLNAGVKLLRVALGKIFCCNLKFIKYNTFRCKSHRVPVSMAYSRGIFLICLAIFLLLNVKLINVFTQPHEQISNIVQR